MSGRHILWSGAAVLALTAGAAGAQDAAPVYLGEILFANLEPVAPGRTGTTVTVVTEETLETESLRVAEVLSHLPGIAIRPNGGIGGLTGFSMRGAPQAYVAVRVDGIDVTDPSNTRSQFDFGPMTAGTVARIEVTPGTQSVLFGGNAVGGAINLTSRQPTEDGWHNYVDAEAGSYDTLSLSYGLTYRDDRGEVAMTVAHVRTEGFSAVDNPGFTEADGYDGTRISINGALQATPGLRLSFAGFVDSSTNEFDGNDPMTFATVDNDATNDSDSYGLRFAADFATGPVTHVLSVSRYAIERASTDGATTTYNGDRDGLHYQGAVDLTANGRLVFGAERTSESFSEAGPWSSDSAEASTNAVFAELTWALGPDVDLAASWRHDDHSEFGGFDSGRLAAVWRATPDWTIRGQLGTGFRAPSLFELYSTAYGDTSLHPETSASADLGIERRIGEDGFIRATAFWLRVEDLIGYDPVTYRSAQTDGTTTRQGIELAAAVPLSDRFTLNADYTHTASEVAGDVAWAAVPENVYGLGIEAEVTDRLGARFDIRHTADRPDLPDFTVADAAMTWDFGNGIAAYARVENLFDEDYHLVDSFGTAYGTPGRSIYVGIHASF